MKLLTALLCAILFAVVGTTTEAQAQYPISNNSNAPVICVCVHTANCGVFGPYCVPAGGVFAAPIPPHCVVTGITYFVGPINICPAPGPFYPVGFNGPVGPPNPPNFLQVNPGNAVFW